MGLLDFGCQALPPQRFLDEQSAVTLSLRAHPSSALPLTSLIARSH